MPRKQPVRKDDSKTKEESLSRLVDVAEKALTNISQPNIPQFKIPEEPRIDAEVFDNHATLVSEVMEVLEGSTTQDALEIIEIVRAYVDGQAKYRMSRPIYS